MVYVKRELVNGLKLNKLKTNYLKNFISINDLQQLLNEGVSIIDLANCYGCKIEVITQRIRHHNLIQPSILYSLEETVTRCKNISSESWDNQGFPKKLIYGDANLYQSILHHTATIIPFTKTKLPERVYRLVIDVNENDILCINCSKPLKFYNFKLGYGNSKLHICKKCWSIVPEFPSGYSKVSQELFWKIAEYLNAETIQDAYFFELKNAEYKIFVNKTDKISLSSLKLNEIYYSVDFFFQGKAIEFDGTYWHSLPGAQEKDAVRDQFFAYKDIPVLCIKEQDYYDNSDKILQECLSFLNLSYSRSCNAITNF